MPRSVRYICTVELHHYEHGYKEITGSEQTLSLRLRTSAYKYFAQITVLNASSKLCRFEVPSSTAVIALSAQWDPRSLDFLL